MRPIVVLHSFGDPGTGGPIVTRLRMMESPLAESYELVRMHQEHAAGGIDYRLLLRWAAMLRELRPDLVHVAGLGNEGFHGVLAARMARVPNVLVTIHGTVRDLTTPRTLRREVLVRAVEPATLTMASHIVAVCRATSERSFLDPWRHKLCGFIPNGIQPMPPPDPGSRTATRARLGIGDDRVVLAVVGRLSFEKGHRVLAAATSLLPSAVRDRITLLLVGDGPDREAILKGYGAVEGLDVRALGLRHDVDSLLTASDVFVFPTLHENLSNALLEAMAASLPVIVTAVGGNVEVVEGGAEYWFRPEMLRHWLTRSNG